MDGSTIDENGEETSLEMPNIITARSNDSEPKPNENNSQEQRKGFTSENFKIEVNGLPKFFGVGEAKKLFKKLKLKAHKFKPVGGSNSHYMFVNFSNDDEKNHAIKVLDGYMLKGKTLKTFAANAEIHES